MCVSAGEIFFLADRTEQNRDNCENPMVGHFIYTRQFNYTSNQECPRCYYTILPYAIYFVNIEDAFYLVCRCMCLYI